MLWAARGDRLHLIARDPDKLAAVATRCTEAASVTTTFADLCDLERAPALVAGALAALGGHVDIVFVAHGEPGDQQRSERDFAAARRLLRPKLLCVIALLVLLANLRSMSRIDLSDRAELNRYR